MMGEADGRVDARGTARGGDYRRRLLAGMAEAIGDVGYAQVTLADIVRRARVSKRTFYEHFATKEDCLLALYETQSARVLAEIEAAIRLVPAGEARLAAGTAVYLTCLQSRAGLVRTLLVEILHVGPRGLAMRRRVMRRFAALLLREIEAAGARTPHSPAIAMALVGGINEQILEAVEENRADRLGELSGAITEFARAFLVPRVAVGARAVPASRGGESAVTPGASSRRARGTASRSR